MDIGIIITVITTVTVAIAAHFIAVGKLKDKIHELELKMKDLEHKDSLQQQALDTMPNIFGIVNRLLDIKGGKHDKN